MESSLTAERFMAGSLDIVGQKYGKLLVVKFLYSKIRTKDKRAHRHYLCHCDCGREKVITTGDLRQGRTTSCGCARKRFQDSPIRQVYQTYKSRCKRTGLLFELTLENFKALCGMHCHYCNRPPSNKSVYRHFKEFHLYNGLDRTDNTKGYVLGNCVPCCELCNKAKRDISYEDFLHWVYEVYKNMQGGKP